VSADPPDWIHGGTAPILIQWGLDSVDWISPGSIWVQPELGSKLNEIRGSGSAGSQSDQLNWMISG